MLQESNISLIKQLNIIDPILQHRDALHAHAKCKAAHFARVVAIAFHKLEYRRIDHAAAQQFDPPAVLAQAAALSAALKTRDGNIGAGFGEWKERREEPRLHIRTEKRFHRVIGDAVGRLLAGKRR